MKLCLMLEPIIKIFNITFLQVKIIAASVAITVVAIAAVVATVLQRFEIEAGFLVKGLEGQLLAELAIIYQRAVLPIGKM